ncbi:MAG: sigma-70 family RNA polymerase sigma factor [Planctomycetota bacterium]|nr:sigma-70 family RNA polymerase sigma factor [Planctomycetota bacterium]
MRRDGELVFEVLVREHLPELLAFVRACIHNRAAADDIVQESFLAAWQQFEEYDKERSFAAWLRGIAHYKILAYRRASSTANRHVCILPPERLTAVASQFAHLTPGRGPAFDDTLAALAECLAGLSEPDREIVRRIYEGEQPCRVIADQLDHTLDSVKKRLQRARARLRDCILGKLNVEVTLG